ncbi:hypothetical protein [Entomobacter blattae]|uniref:Uncharacterized protein n=1 Tax=Entomobacter blattae TaxID=2762277 RepID=A0A7H1NUR4_9PROT|nr:hypothetical protein [Entomobacter blattae]QNT79524.1 hypothetical protein JGUZn3_23230 [Entomobacter blattae]
MTIRAPDKTPSQSKKEDVWQNHSSAVEEGPHAPSWIEKDLYDIFKAIPLPESPELTPLATEYLDKLAQTNSTTDLNATFASARNIFLAQLVSKNLLNENLYETMNMQLEALEEKLIAQS